MFINTKMKNKLLTDNGVRLKEIIITVAMSVLLSTVVGCAGQKTASKQASRISQDLNTSDEMSATDNAQQLTQRQRLLALPNKYKNQQVSVDQHLLKAVEEILLLMSHENNAQAKVNLVGLSNQYPTMSAPKLYLGDIALKDNEMTIAANYYQQAIALNPDNYYAHNRLATVYRKQGMFILAKEHYEAALASWPAFAPAHLNLGILFDLYLGDQASALIHYETYQILTESSDRKVNGWIKDVTMQIRRGKKS